MDAPVMEDALPPHIDKTQQTLDTLADLFLTSQPQVAASDGASTDQGAVHAPASNQPVSQNASLAEAFFAHQPASPIKLRPKPMHSGAPGTGGPASKGYPITNHTTPGPELALTPQAAATIDQLPAAEIENTAATNSPQEPIEPESSGTAHVEAVLLGNLPGLAGPWATQYAQAVADSAQDRVLLIHADDHSTALELIQPASQKPLQDTLELPRQPSDVRPFVRKLLTDPVHPINRVLVRTEPAATPEQAARLTTLKSWTWLSGADDLSIAAAEQTLTSLSQTFGEQQSASNANRHLQLVIAGCDSDSARPAAGRIAQGLAQVAGYDVIQPTGCIPKMSPARIQPLGTFPSQACGLDALITDLAGLSTPPENFRPALLPTPASGSRGSQAPAPEQAYESAPETAATQATDPFPEGGGSPFEQPIEYTRSQNFRVPPQPRPTTPGSTHTHQKGSDPFLAEEARDPRIITPPHRARPVYTSQTAPLPTDAQQSVAQTSANETAQAAPSVESPHPQAPAPGSQTPGSQAPGQAASPIQPQASSIEDAPNLTSLLTAEDHALAGSIRLDARCPKHEDVELVLDQDGRLHLLAKHEEGTDPGILRDAMLDLMAARTWVNEHKGLIALTQRQLKFDPNTEPQLHLFTPRADWATGLITRLGNALRLHLLAKVNVGDQATWFTTALN